MWLPPYHAVQGIHLYATNGGSFTNMGMPPTRKKGSHLPPRTTKLCNLRNGCDSVTAPTVKPDLGFSSWYKGCCSVKPTQGCQKCDRSTFSGVATGTLDRLAELSHYASNLSCPHNLLPKGCDLCFA